MDTTPPQIQKMNPQTAIEIAELEKQCFSSPWSLDSLIGELSNPVAVYYTAIIDGHVAGYAGIHHIVDEGYITNIAVAPKNRRMGIARLLMETLLDYARENNLVMLTLEVRPSNEAALSLYKGFGFKEEGRRKNYYRDPTEDALILTCSSLTDWKNQREDIH